MIPAHYMELIEPLDGVRSMLELGNKRGTGGARDPYKAYFAARGIRHVCVDWNGEDGALARDLRLPLHLGRFDMVTNIGTSEHVDGQLGVWRNMIDAAEYILVCITPKPGDWPGHGLFYPTAKFYVSLANENGFHLDRCYVDGPEGRAFIYARLRRLVDQPFRGIREDLIERAPPREQRGRA